MAINIHERYAPQLAQEFEKHSYIRDTNKEFSFEGVASIKVTTADTMPLVRYKRDGLNRFGEVKEIGDSVQTLLITQDQSFTGSLDEGYKSEQQKIKKAGTMMRNQIRNVLNPTIDKYAFGRYATNGGIIKGMAAPTKTTIVNAIFDATTAMDNADVPTEGRVLYIGATMYNLMRLSTEFLNAQALNAKVLQKGEMGMIADCKVVKVPDNMLPTGVHFLITHSSSVLLPKKISMTRILEEVQGVHGSVLEGRSIYDAFVLGARANGVYVAALADLVIADPVVSNSGAAYSATSAGNVLYYTTDNSDPRYSASAKVYTGAVTLQVGQTIKFCAKNDNKLTSGVVSRTHA